MPSKSIFRQPGAKHFQLVHRSQRDPLIHDPDASQHVLRPFERENAKKGKSRADLEALLAPDQLISDTRPNVGEAALYGVYYDDSEYDYMQHLRQVGVQEDGVDSVLIEAPSTSKPKPKQTKKSPIQLVELPQSVLASSSELPRTYESQQAVPESIAGFQPDMDPHLRQVLEALEDDAFVDDDLADDFFGELVAEGERDADEDVQFDFDEDGFEEEEGVQVEEAAGEEAGWEERFAAFKKANRGVEPDGKSDFGSEGGDTVGGLPEMSVIGGKGKKRRKGTSEASGYSMSSSSMYRNEALQTLDERFDQMILKEYNNDDDDEPSPSDSDTDSDDAPELITSREDFDSMVNEFLNDFEILGRKMKPKLAGESGTDKLDTLRRAMGQDERVRVAAVGEDDGASDEDDLMMEEEDKKDRWDCETILTTYTNLENHPRLIRARDPKPVPKIHLDSKTGLPSILPPSSETQKPPTARGRVSFDDSDSDTETESRAIRHTVTRPKDESKEEKKVRKAAVKAERQERRAEKKVTKEKFGTELKVQKTTIVNKERRMKKL